MEVEVDGNGQVDIAVQDQLVVADARVDVGKLPKGIDEGTGDEWEIGEAEPFVAFPVGAVGGPDLLDALEVDLDCGQHVG